MDAVDLGPGGVAGIGETALGLPGAGQEAERGRAGRAVEGVHLPGEVLDRVPVLGGQGLAGLLEQGVPAGRAVAGQPDRRLAVSQSARLISGMTRRRGISAPRAISASRSRAAVARWARRLRARPTAAATPARVAAVVVLSVPAGRSEGGADRLAFAHRRHPGRDLGGLEQWPVVAGVDHQQVGFELEGALHRRHQGAEGLVGPRQVDDLVAPFPATARSWASITWAGVRWGA